MSFSPRARLTVSERTVPAKVKCPTCRKEVSWEHNPHRPFCSERCQLIDLGAWAQECYRIPAEEMDFDSDEEDADDEEGRR
jgi:endogenous inhibitor of DNA gyrase (YacG/DUF329 family)